MSLRLLEPDVRARLRSGVAISSISQCVQELVENSIDAEASCVAVHIDVPRFKLQVADNGTGISFEDFKLLGERYATSKAHCLSDLEHLRHYGYRGEALASTTEVSGTVEVSSRHRASQQTYTKMFHNGKSVSVTVSQTPRPSIGTTVAVHDFFYNLPVRRGVISEALELERVQRAIQCSALINPSVSFTLRNDKTGQCLAHAPRTNSVLNRFAQLFGQERTRSMKEHHVTSGDYSIKGHISTEGHHSKSLQFVYVNKRVVKRTQLHAAANSLLANSLLTKKVPRLSKTDDKVAQSGQTGRTSVPIFILQLTCPPSQFDITLEPTKTLIEFKEWDVVLEALQRLVVEFLEENGLAVGLCHVILNLEGGSEGGSATSSPVAPEFEEDSDRQEAIMPARMQSSKVVKRRVMQSGLSSAISHVSEVESVSALTGCSSLVTSPVPSLCSQRTVGSGCGLPLPADGHTSVARRGTEVYTNMDEGLGSVPVGTAVASSEALSVLCPSKVTKAGQSTSQACIHGPSCKLPHTSILYGPHHEGRDAGLQTSSHGISQRLLSIARKHTGLAGSNDHTMPSSALEAAGIQLSSGCQMFSNDSRKASESTASHVHEGPIETSADTTSCAIKDHLSIVANRKEGGTKRPIWVQRTDPLTRRKIYVHTISGNTSSAKPPELACDDGTVCSGIVLGPRPTLPPSSRRATSSGPAGSTHCVTATIAAAPHLTHSFTPFVPRDKTTRHPLSCLDEGVEMGPCSSEQGSLHWFSPSKWREDRLHDVAGQVPSSSTVPLLLQNWENPAFGPSKERDVLGISAAGSKAHSRLQGVIGSYKFSKEMFQHLKVLGQVDEKFIACMMDYSRSGSHDLLVLIDQHAAHERVRVEILTGEVYASSGSKVVHQCIKQSMVKPPIVMDLQPSQKKLARHFRERLESVGVSLTFQADDVLVSSIPTVLMDREVTEVTRGRPTVAVGIVRELITDYLEVLQNTSGGAVTLPRVVSDVLNSQACHGAIKFGDPLTQDECVSLIQSLSKCRLPFQCAHGRPSLVPLLDLNLLRRRLSLQVADRHPSCSLNKLHARMMKN